jgi:hypothetical protein
MDQLMQKLMISKQIMDKHNTIGRGNASSNVRESSEIQNFDIPQAKYNIPSEFLDPKAQSQLTSTPKQSGPPTLDAIKKSKLPDDIKRLMIEHPIEKPQQQSVGLSDDLIEKASRLMKEQSNNYVPDSAKNKVPSTPKQTSENTSIKQMIKESVEEVLKEYGVIAETTEKTNEIFSFKVGKHIFEGKVTKVKKIS